MEKDNPVIQRLIQWGERRADIRAIILSSSRTNPHVQYWVDPLSDYDIDVVIQGEARSWYEDRSWLEDFGKVLVGWVEPPGIEYGIENFGCVILYEDGTKIDYTIMPVETFQHVVSDPNLRGGWDNGYQVLLDKDGMAAGLKPPTYQEFIPRPPTRQEYRETIDRFFTEATYVAKNLWRDELIFMKHSFDEEMKGMYLCRMLEWRMELDYDWSVRLGVHGKWLKKRLPPEIWSALESTYEGAGLEENWAALWKTIALFRDVAVEVGSRLGYAYPYDLDKKMAEYLEKVRDLNHF